MDSHDCGELAIESIPLKTPICGDDSLALTQQSRNFLLQTSVGPTVNFNLEASDFGDAPSHGFWEAPGQDRYDHTTVPTLTDYSQQEWLWICLFLMMIGSTP